MSTVSETSWEYSWGTLSVEIWNWCGCPILRQNGGIVYVSQKIVEDGGVGGLGVLSYRFLFTTGHKRLYLVHPFFSLKVILDILYCRYTQKKEKVEYYYSRTIQWV